MVIELHPHIVSPVVKKPSKPNPLRVSSKNIDTFKSRSIHTIINDLAHFCNTNKNAAAKILLARGVARLFKQKSNLGKLAVALKTQVRELHETINSAIKPSKKKVKENQDMKTYYMLLGELNATARFRKKIEDLVTTRGMQLPDDNEFKRLLQVSSRDVIKEIKEAK